MMATISRATSAASSSTPFKPVARKRSVGFTVATHAVVKTQNGVLDVHVGPSYFLMKEGLSLEKGDSVKMTGSKVTVNGQEAFIAREVKKAGKIYVLRDSAGKPMWSGAKR